MKIFAPVTISSGPSKCGRLRTFGKFPPPPTLLFYQRSSARVAPRSYTSICRRLSFLSP